MGWCSGTQIFDSVVGALLKKTKRTEEEVISDLVDALEDMDWDCQQDSAFWDDPIVRRVFMAKHPEWFRGNTE